jgi:serine/threonine-protein kinase
LKPENVFLVWDDEDGADMAKVVDFGIAKFTDGSIGPSSATRTGSVLGTPYYMSPEQARGLRSVDYRTDIWSLGVIAYRCIVGVLPFDGEAIGDLLVKLCTAPIPLPSQVISDAPPGFDAFILRALERDPAQRFQSAQDFALSLAAVCGLSLRSYGTGEQPHYLKLSGLSPHPTIADPLPTQVASAHELAAATGAPLTQTAPTVARGGRTSAVVASALTASVVLAIGIGVAVKMLGSPAEDATTLASQTASPLPAVVALTASATPESPIVVVAPKATASVSAQPATVPVPHPSSRPLAVRPALQSPRTVAPPPVAPPRPRKPEIDVGY